MKPRYAHPKTGGTARIRSRAAGGFDLQKGQATLNTLPDKDLSDSDTDPW